MERPEPDLIAHYLDPVPAPGRAAPRGSAKRLRTSRGDADLLVTEGNPLEDLTEVTNRDHLKIIMKDGQICKNTLSSHPYSPSGRPRRS